MFRSLYKILHPAVFQGSLKKKNYFEGWYYKHVSPTGKEAFAVIPGISLSDNSHAFIQFIDGKTGQSEYIRYDIGSFRFDPKKLDFRIGDSHFSYNSISLNLLNINFSVKGSFSYTDIRTIPSTILSPGIMGWYSWVPGMECNHGVVSADHLVSGKLEYNGRIADFSGGHGYIEKDWGTSFPESWIWLHCNNFGDQRASLMISVAKIPWKGSYFMGLISFLMIGNSFYLFATYNGAKIQSLKRDSNTSVVIRKGDLLLTVHITGKGAGVLKAPDNGSMKNIIKESIDSEVVAELKLKDKLVFSGKGIRAGFEETEKIYKYFRD